MASPDVEFYEIPGSIRKPGKYFEFNTRLAVRTLPGNPQNLLLIAPMLNTGTAAPLTAVDVFSNEQAAALFGRGSAGHLMATAAIGANNYLRLQMIGLPEDAEGVAATGAVVISGAATATGLVRLQVGDSLVDVTVATGDTADAVARALITAVAASTALPVTASPTYSSGEGGEAQPAEQVPGSVTLTARSKGASGNGIVVRGASTATGITLAVTTMTGGLNDADIAPALAAVFGAGHDIIVSPFSTQDALTALRTHLDAVSGPMEQRGATGVAGWPGSLSTGTTLASSLNSGRLTVGWHNGSVKSAAEIAAAYAAVIASEEDPARPLNTLAMSTLDVTAPEYRPGRMEQENALYNGLTPFEIGPGDKVQIVRAITTYTRNAEGTEDVSLLDLTTIRTLDYVRKACRERISLRFPRDKLSSRTPRRVRSELLDVLYALDDLEIIEEVDANKDALIVERDSKDVNRLNARIPCDVVNGLHVFAGRIDLLL